MAIKSVLRMGEAGLLKKSLKVSDPGSDEVKRLLVDMWDTMHSLNGAGLAAPQIGVNLQVVIFGFEKNERYPEAPDVPLTVLINPEIEVIDSVMESGWEGCLSVPGLRGLVSRYNNIRYIGLDEHGQAIDRIVEGFHARVVQHECDHLNGYLYPQRMTDFRYFGFCDELEKNQYLMDSI
ncbi:MAG: peptide deformylase [Gammaproteobacteria bacterium]|jgi:peptide deformylase